MAVSSALFGSRSVGRDRPVTVTCKPRSYEATLIYVIYERQVLLKSLVFTRQLTRRALLTSVACFLGLLTLLWGWPRNQTTNSQWTVAQPRTYKTRTLKTFDVIYYDQI